MQISKYSGPQGVKGRSGRNSQYFKVSRGEKKVDDDWHSTIRWVGWRMEKHHSQPNLPLRYGGNGHALGATHHGSFNSLLIRPLCNLSIHPPKLGPLLRYSPASPNPNQNKLGQAQSRSIGTGSIKTNWDRPNLRTDFDDAHRQGGELFGGALSDQEGLLIANHHTVVAG